MVKLNSFYDDYFQNSFNSYITMISEYEKKSYNYWKIYNLQKCCNQKILSKCLDYHNLMKKSLEELDKFFSRQDPDYVKSKIENYTIKMIFRMNKMNHLIDTANLHIENYEEKTAIAASMINDSDNISKQNYITYKKSCKAVKRALNIFDFRVKSTESILSVLNR